MHISQKRLRDRCRKSPPFPSILLEFDTHDYAEGLATGRHARAFSLQLLMSFESTVPHTKNRPLTSMLHLLPSISDISLTPTVCCSSMAIRFLFEATGSMRPSHLILQPFQPRATRNDYTIPWALRGLIEDRRISMLFGPELAELRLAFDKWQPKTNILREVRRKLEPVRQAPPPSADQDTTSSKL